MDDVKRMLVERACERLVAEYCHLVDHGEGARVAELFTEDGIWASSENTLNGCQDIRAGFQRRQDNTGRISRHVCCNMLIEVLDEDHAEGVVYLTLYRHDGDPARRTAPAAPPDIVGEYRDKFERTPQGWRFSRRELVASFARPGAENFAKS